MSFCLVLLAAGNSKRFGGNVPKPYVKVGEKTILDLCLQKFKKIKQIKKIVVVINKKHKNYLKNYSYKELLKITGGNNRQESTLKALRFIKNKKIKCSNVLIHDVARPNFSINLIKKIIKHSKGRAVIPRIYLQDALKHFVNRDSVLSLARDNFFLTQTPQSFPYIEIFKLHKNNKARYKDDDLSLLGSLKKVKFIDGEKSNFKLTNNEDLLMLKNYMSQKYTTGIGFDVHRLVPKRKLYLAGLKIKSDIGTLGHSDGDPALHSIIDAVLGACQMGDIGEIFSDKNKKFKNIRSTILLKETMIQIKARGYYLKNLDINIIIQKPKIKNYKNKMIANISKLCNIQKNKINIKGKTTEKLGVIGKERAVATEVLASVIKYD